MEELTDVRYEVEDGLAWITIDRPERMNAFRARTVDELIQLPQARVGKPRRRAWSASPARAIAPSAPAATRSSARRPATTAPRSRACSRSSTLHRLIREIPKPVIAAVNGYAIGGGHVLHVLCDLTIAVDNARFGQTRPARGLLRRRLRHRLPRARRRREARPGDLVAVPAVRRCDGRALGPREPGRAASAELHAEVRRWADEILALSPTALRFLKQSFNADSEHMAGIGQLAFTGLGLFVDTDEAHEGVRSFADKRPPDFTPYRERVSA